MSNNIIIGLTAIRAEYKPKKKIINSTIISKPGNKCFPKIIKIIFETYNVIINANTQQWKFHRHHTFLVINQNKSCIKLSVINNVIATIFTSFNKSKVAFNLFNLLFLNVIF